MEVFQKEINEIVRSCAEDENLRRIVLSIHRMEKKERDEFFQKMNAYFPKQKSPVEAQAYRFFNLLLKDDVRNLVVEKLERKFRKGS